MSNPPTPPNPPILPTIPASADSLIQVAGAIRAWQKGRVAISDEALIRRFPGLGSSKTYVRILNGELGELRTERWLEKYLAVLDQIDSEAAAVSQDTALYDDLTPARQVREAMASVMRSRGIERLVLIEGGTGTGKTSSLRCIEERHSGATWWVEAHEGWRSYAAAMGDLCLATRAVATREKLPVSAADRLSRVIEHVGQSRRIVLIDEGHHMTPAVINSIKTLINQTAAVFVVAAQDTLWRKLAACSMQEAKQLILNRCRERVRLGAPTQQDAIDYLARRCGLEIGERTARAIVQASGPLGAFAFLRRLAEALTEQGATTDDESIAQIMGAIRADLS